MRKLIIILMTVMTLVSCEKESDSINNPPEIQKLLLITTSEGDIIIYRNEKEIFDLINAPNGLSYVFNAFKSGDDAKIIFETYDPEGRMFLINKGDTLRKPFPETKFIPIGSDTLRYYVSEINFVVK